MTQHSEIATAECIEGHLERVEANDQRIIQSAKDMESLLIAEDDETVRVVLKKILEKIGYKVFVADSSEDAVALFKQRREISLVLSEVVMHRKSGKAMVADMREINPGVKALFISGHPADIIHKKCLFGESDEFMAKPFKLNDLLKKIRELLDND